MPKIVYMVLNVSTVPWEECLQSLQVLVPGAESLALSEIWRAMEQQGHKPKLIDIPDWEKLDDIEIFRKIFGPSATFGSDGGILIPDLCFWDKHLPFRVNRDCMEKFMESFLVQYRERFFNGD